MMSIGQIVGFAELVAGIVLGYTAWQMYNKNQRKLAKWPRKLGVVTGFKCRSADGDGSTKHPVIEFQTENGSKISFESRLGSTSWKFGVGSEIEIIVNPHNPKDAEILGFGAQTFGPIVMGAMSGVMIIGAPVVFIFL